MAITQQVSSTNNQLTEFQTNVLEIMFQVAQDGPLKLFNAPASIQSTTKSDGSDVTAEDKAAEDRLTRELTLMLPGSKVLGEESSGKDEAWRRSPLLKTKNDLWIIDPIDGTSNFIRKKPFGMLVGLRERNGNMIFAVAHYPVSGDFLLASAAIPTTQYVQRMNDGTFTTRTVQTPQLQTNFMVFEYGLHHRGGEDPRSVFGPIVDQFGKGTQRTHCIATGLKELLLRGDRVWVTSGKYTPWDYETTAFIARKAGATVKHLDGREAATTPEANTALFTPTVALSEEIIASYNRQSRTPLLKRQHETPRL